MTKQKEPASGQFPTKPIGRPPKLTEEERAEVYAAFKEYIDITEDPTIVWFTSYDEVAIQYNVTKDNIHDWAEFSELRKRAIDKQEAYLVRMATKNLINPTVAIFRLKQPQHGYRDRQELTGDDGKDLIPQFTSEQAEQLLRLRAKRGSTSK